MIRFYKPTIRRSDMNAVLQTMVDEKIGPGERKRAFTVEFCEQVGKRYGVMLRSFYDALRLALESAGLQSGDCVGMSLLAPRIYGIVCKSLGLTVKLGDINPSCGCLSLEEALRLESEGVKAIMLDEPMGMIPYGVDYSALQIPLIEDITESLGSSYPDSERPDKPDVPGKRGALVVCAFEESDMISCGGGAALLSSVKEYKDAWTGKLEGIRSYVEMPDMNAAMGIVQSETFEEQVTKRRSFYRTFRENLLKTRHKPFGIGAIDYDINGFGFAVFLDSKIEDVMAFATKYQVPSQKTFQTCMGRDKMDDFDHFPKGIPFMVRTLSFPIYPFISKNDMNLLIKVISHLP